MIKDNFFKNSITLILSNFAIGILKFIFSIILSKTLGPEGMGLYSLIMPIYDLSCCLVCGGLVTAVSKESAVLFNKKDYKNLSNSIKTCFCFEIIWSSIIAIIVFLFSPFISTYIIKDKRALYSIKVICPAIIFVSLSSILKGYFYGISKVNIPSIIDIFEKSVRIITVVKIINIFTFKEMTQTITTVYFALTLGEFISISLLLLYYKNYKKKLNANSNIFKPEKRSQLLFNILVVSIPLCINGFLSTTFSTISTLIIPRRLMHTGMIYKDALEIIGRYNGMALNITLFPVIIITSISLILVPDISQNLNRGNYYSLEKRIHQVLRVSFIVGIATLIISLTISDSLGVLFYKRYDLGSYIKYSAFSAPFVYISLMSFSILNGLGEQNVVLRNSIIISIEELFLLYIFTGIKSINIHGYTLSLIINCASAFIINTHEINKHCEINFTSTHFIIDILSGFLVYLTLNIVNNLIPNSLFIFKNIFIIILGFSLYFFIIFISNIIEEN